MLLRLSLLLPRLLLLRSRPPWLTLELPEAVGLDDSVKLVQRRHPLRVVRHTVRQVDAAIGPLVLDFAPRHARRCLPNTRLPATSLRDLGLLVPVPLVRLRLRPVHSGVEVAEVRSRPNRSRGLFVPRHVEKLGARSEWFIWLPIDVRVKFVWIVLLDCQFSSLIGTEGFLVMPSNTMIYIFHKRP